MKLLFCLVGLLAFCVPSQVRAQAWSEPTISGILMTAPSTPPPVTGATFYVDKNSIGGTCNNANAGTVTAPWCSIGKAMATLGAGQRAYIRTATYNEGSLRPTNSGTPGNYITFQAYPGESPVMNCAGFTFCFEGSTTGSKSYVVISGIEFHHPNQQFMVCYDTPVGSKLYGCHHWWFVHDKIHDTGAPAGFSGFDFASHNNVVSDSEIYNCSAMCIYTGADEQGHDNIFEFNVIHDSGRNGDDDGAIKLGTGSWNSVARYNHVYNNWRNPASAAPCFGGPGNCQGITGIYLDIEDNVAHGGMTWIYNNISHDNDIGIQVNQGRGVRVFNNISYHNGFTAGAGTFLYHFKAGLALGDTGSNMQVYNNTIVGNAGRGLDLWNIPAGSLIARNNIIQGNAAEVYYFGGALNLDMDYDLIADPTGGVMFDWNGGIYNTVAAFKARSGNIMETHAVATPASFVNSAAGNYHLTSSSVGLDLGTPVSLFTYDKDNVSRPQGTVWDVGAYEFVSGGGTPVCPAP